MTNIISGASLRDKLLARLAVKEPMEWVQVLAAPSNRELLGLIARELPESIGQLSELAGRAQPNVSRSLSALVESGLVEVENLGRRSLPRLTKLGHEKAAAFGLLGEVSPPPKSALDEVVAASNQDVGLSVASTEDPAKPLTSDCVQGSFALKALFREGGVFCGTRDVDIVATARDLTDHWWRIVYRADAPFSLGEFRNPEGQVVACWAKATGRKVDIWARRTDADGAPTIGATFATEAFEAHLLNGIVKPVVAILRSGQRYDRPLESSLSQIEEVRSYPNEHRFFRTVGALGLSTVDLTEAMASSVRALVQDIDDEDVRLDFASAVLADDLQAGCDWITRELGGNEKGNRLPRLIALRNECLSSVDMTVRKPWKLGISLAKAVRAKLNLPTDYSLKGVDNLVREMGADKTVSYSSEPPASLMAFQSTRHDEPIIATSDRGPIGSAFVMARAIGDYVAFGSHSACVTELYTERQAVGRAFAAELLAPSEAVNTMMRREDKSMHAIAAHFGVSTEVVRHQYENNTYLARAVA